MAYQWVPIGRGEGLRSGAVLSGHTRSDGDVYVGRKLYEIGKINIEGNKFYNFWGHRHGSSDSAELLVVADGVATEWVPYKKGDPLPEGAVCGGQNDKDGRVYVAREKKGGACGKLNVNDDGTCCNLWIHGSIMAWKEGDVLVIKSPECLAGDTFEKGEKVEVKSVGEGRWVTALVVDVAFTDGTMNGHKVKAGTIKVEYLDGSNKAKYITPDMISSLLRKISDEVLTEESLLTPTQPETPIEVFECGEKVEVFSTSENKWNAATVKEFASTSDYMMMGYTVQRGTVLIEYANGGTKCITPDRVSSSIRRISAGYSVAQEVDQISTTLPTLEPSNVEHIGSTEDAKQSPRNRGSSESSLPPLPRVSHVVPPSGILPSAQKPKMSDSNDLHVVAVGDGGISQMQEYIDEGTVMWAIVAVHIGEGSLRKRKCIFLHVNGAYCNNFHRARINQYTPRVKKMVSDAGTEIHMPEVEVRYKEDVTPAYILDRVKNYFIVDSATYSIEWLVNSYEKMIKETRERQKALDVRKDEGQGRRIPGHLSEEVFGSGRDALKHVLTGPANWVFWTSVSEPKSMEIIEGGLGMVTDMADCLSEHTAQVMFGLIRMPFGCGRFARDKYVFVHAIGQNAPPVERAHSSQALGKMKTLVDEVAKEEKKAKVSVSMEVGIAEELTVETVVELVRKAAIVDDDDVAGDTAGKEILTVENFREAVQEEQRKMDDDEAEMHAEKRYVEWSERPLQEVVRLVHHEEVANWALFAPGDDWNTGVVPPSIKVLSGKLRPDNKGFQAQLAKSGFLGALRRQQVGDPPRPPPIKE